MDTKIMQMLRSGISVEETHLQKLLRSILNNQLQSLKHQAKIPVADSRNLIGVSDQSGKLAYKQCFVHITADRQLFTINGPVIVVKNPCLHIGDIRILEAVDVDELSHLKDVIVFPTQGPRPHTDEISGSDCDGDKYIVIWWKPLLRMLTEYDAANYEEILTDVKALPTNPVDIIAAAKDYLINFFEYAPMVGKISNLHLAWVDKKGMFDPITLKLAYKHHLCIDSTKTMTRVGIEHDLEYLLDEKNGGIPHFLQALKERKNQNISNIKSYHSKGILGKLFDAVEAAEKEHFIEADLPVPQIDSDLQLPNRERFMKDAKIQFKRYNKEVSEMLDQIKTTQDGADPEEVQELKNCRMKGITQKYKEEFYRNLNTTTMYHPQIYDKASAWYCACYENAIDKWEKQQKPGLTFAWIVDDILCRIKSDTKSKEHYGRLAPTQGIFR